MNGIYRFLFILHLFVGIGALVPSFLITIKPSGQLMGVSTEMLDQGPFTSFLIPGLVLFLLVGCAQIIGGILAYKRSLFQGFYSSLLGFILICWIVVQCFVLNTINILHVLYFTFGIIEFSLGLILIIKIRKSFKELVKNTWIKIKRTLQ